MALIRLTLARAKQYWAPIAAVIALQFLSTLALLWLPSLNAKIIDEGIANGDLGFIWRTGATMLGASIVQIFCAIGAIYFGARTAMAIGRDLRQDVYAHVNTLSTVQTTTFGAGTLITRGTNDVQQVQLLTLMTLNFMVTTPLMSVGGIIMALREDAGLAWLVWVAVGVLAVVVGWLVWLLLPLFRSMQDRIDAINSVLREQIMGLRVVRAFVREDFETERYDTANRNITRVSLKVGNLFVLMFPAVTMVLHLATAAVLWFGAERVDAGQIEVGSLTAFLQYLMLILVAVMMGIFMMMLVPRAVVSAERIEALLRTEAELKYPEVAVAPDPGHGRIEFRNVTFGFPGAEKPVIHNVSFTVEPRTTTAIVGSTGSGKTVLLHLLLRMFDPQHGSITIDGVPVKDLTRAQLAQAMALVPQQQYLFGGTIASNLRFGREDASDAELWEALETAQAKDFVTATAGGLDEPVAQGGASVSGGQRQRLSIARALIADPLIYLFDDSFSALDVKTDAKLRAALPKATPNATRLVVAQRVSSIMDADQILVLDRGEIVGRGRHEELLETSEVYREIVASQLDEGEAQA